MASETDPLVSHDDDVLIRQTREADLINTLVEEESRKKKALFDMQRQISFEMKDSNDAIPNRSTTTITRRKMATYNPRTSFSDHFSLETPSDEIRFNTCTVRVYSIGTGQFQIVEEEESKKKTLQAKITSDGSSSLSFLRACYTLITVLMVGFLLIFAIQVLFFLFVSLISNVGLTSKQSLDWYQLAGTLLSIPVLVYGLASALTMATEFVSDTWNGHEFFRSVLMIPSAVIDWFYLVMYLGLPLGVLLWNMFTSEHWWVVTALTWFGSVTVAYCVFCGVVFVVEILGALELLAHHPDHELLDLRWRNVGAFLGRAIVLRQIQAYSGTRVRTFLIEGTKEYPSANVSYDESDLADREHTEETISMYSKFTRMMAWAGWFETYESPKRMYNVEDVLDRIVYVTDSSWSLEKFFCRRKDSRQVLVVNGPSRILPSQAMSSFICIILGNILMIGFFAALLKWGGLSTATIIILTLLFTFYRRREFYQVYVMWDTYRDTLSRRTRCGSSTTDMSDSEAIYRVSEKHCVTRPKEWICWFFFICEILGLFVYPLWVLCHIGNTAIAVLFALLGVFSACRHYFSAPVVLGELGSLDLLDGEFIRSRNSSIAKRSAVDISEDDWREKNRLAKIVGRISQGDRLSSWINIIAAFVLVFLFLFLSAFAGGSDDGKSVKDPSSYLLHDFEYVSRKNTFQYPTCDMTADFNIPGGGMGSHAMLDYAYIAGIAYSAPESMPELLDRWFGEGVAYDDVDTVNEFHSSLDIDSVVHYKLIRFPANPEFAIMAIRGTNNGWDMISDAQLWSASILAQVVRTSLPFGEIWNPILEELVSLIAVVQSASLRKVAFYVQTTGFVNYIKSKNIFSTLRITGHSLGGGLAMITGAQTQTPAIGLSGPNTMITRSTLNPPVTVDNLNAYTFNIIPDRDPVAKIDDPAKNTQKIACLADTNNFIDCHSAKRSLCEIMYTCGNGAGVGPQHISRPVLCQCVLDFGYPEPEPTGNRTFSEACGSGN